MKVREPRAHTSRMERTLVPDSLRGKETYKPFFHRVSFAFFTSLQASFAVILFSLIIVPRFTLLLLT